MLSTATMLPAENSRGFLLRQAKFVRVTPNRSIHQQPLLVSLSLAPGLVPLTRIILHELTYYALARGNLGHHPVQPPARKPLAFLWDTTHECLLPGRIYCSVLYAAHGFAYRTNCYAFMRASFAAIHRLDVLLLCILQQKNAVVSTKQARTREPGLIRTRVGDVGLTIKTAEILSAWWDMPCASADQLAKDSSPLSNSDKTSHLSGQRTDKFSRSSLLKRTGVLSLSCRFGPRTLVSLKPAGIRTVGERRMYFPLPDGYHATHEKHPSILPSTSLGTILECVPPEKARRRRPLARPGLLLKFYPAPRPHDQVDQDES